MATSDKPSHIKFRLRAFDDAELETLLGTGSNFRRLNITQRNNILQEMINETWEPDNGQTIVISDKGKLLNGQHRLSAAQIYQRQTGHLVWFWTAENVKESTVKTMDTGDNRRVIQYLTNEGIEHASTVQAIALADARLSLMPKSETLLAATSTGLARRENKENTTRSSRPSISLTIDRWRRNRGAMQDWAKIGADMEKAKLPRPSLLVSLGYQLAKKDESKAKLFFERLTTGEGIKKVDPIYVLRQRLISDRLSNTKMQRTTMAAILIKAWVAWNEGREVSTLRWISTGPSGEDFPSHKYQTV